MSTLNRLWQDDEGQDVVEYVLVAALFSLAAYLMFGPTGTSIGSLWTSVSSSYAAAT